MPNADANYRLSKYEYYADFYLVPFATSIAVIWLYSLHVVDPVVFTSAIFVGVVAWTFAEYAIHRWVYHGFSQLRRYHAFHHMKPGELIGNSSRFTAIAGALAFWLLTWLFGPVIGVGLLVGFVCGYLSYIFVHDRFHRHSESLYGTWMAKLNANHDYHHRHARRNFGVTSPFWDIVFGTYQAPR